MSELQAGIVLILLSLVILLVCVALMRGNDD